MFVRLKNIPYPSTWLKFEASNSDGTPTTYEIRDLIDSDLDEALDLMRTFYLRDEPTSKVTKLLDDPESIEDNIRNWKKCQAQKMPIACYETKSGKLVGVNFLYVTSKDDEESDLSQLKGSSSKWSFKLYGNSIKEFDAFGRFHVDEVLIEFGLGVHPDYRLRGIATQLLKARVPMMEAMGIRHALTGFSAVGSKKAGEKAGYRVVIEYR